MTTTTPKFSQLSSLNPTKQKENKPTMRPGFYADQLKGKQSNVWRTLHNY